MKIETQVCLLPQAKRLKELGVGQNGYFHYIGNDTDCPYTLYEDWRAREEVGSSWYDYRVSAFTVAELGVMLPHMITEKGKSYPEYDFVCSRNYSDDPDEPTANRLWSCAYQNDGACLALFEPETTEAAARCSMLIHLLENNIITADEVNKRLAG